MEILQSNEQLARSLPETRFISIADISELFCQCEEFAGNFDFIIRGGRQHTNVSAKDTATEQSPAGVSTVIIGRQFVRQL